MAAARSRFARNVWQLAGANALAQALPLVVAPLLTRLYTPADFAWLAVFTSATSLALAVGTGRFEWSVPSARSAGGAAALLVIGALALGGLVVVLLAAGPWLHAALPVRWQLPAAAAALLPLAVAGGGLQQLLQSWHVRGGELSTAARAKVWQGVATAGVPLAAAPLAPSPWSHLGLIAGAVAGSWAGVASLWRRAAGLAAAIRRTTGTRLRATWRRHRAEAAWSTLVSVLNTASFAVVPLLLLRHHGAVEVGFYALMQRVALAPIGLVTGAVSQSFWAEAARLVRTDPAALRRLYLHNTARLAGLGAGVAAVALAAPWYVGPLFGAGQWQGAGAVLAASAPMLAGVVIASPLSHLVVHGRQQWQALWDLGRLLAIVVTVETAAVAGLGMAATVLAISTMLAVMYALLIVLNLQALRRTPT
jgi:O-antigen/teichoic acid export membrane protein